MPATDAEAELYGYAVPTDDNTMIGDLPSIIRQNARAAAPEAWVNVTLQANVVASGGNDREHPKVRMTALGLQMRGEVKVMAAFAMDATLFTVPEGYRPVSVPNRRFMSPAMGSGPDGNYSALAYQCELRPDGRVTTRQPLANGTIVNFGAIIPYLD